MVANHLDSRDRCGTDLDPQGLERQEETLRSVGALVAPTNAQAARLAGLIVAGRG